MVKQYNYFSQFPFVNDYEGCDKQNRCIAFQMGNEFWLNKNPFDVMPMMFLHPISSRVKSSDDYVNQMINSVGEIEKFLFYSKLGLLTGEAEVVLKYTSILLTNTKSFSTDSQVNLNTIKNMALFTLGRYCRPELLELSSSPVLNCQYLLSVIKLESLKDLKENIFFSKILNLFLNELDGITNSDLRIILESHILKYQLEISAESVVLSTDRMLEKLKLISSDNRYNHFLATESKRRNQENVFKYLYNADMFEDAEKIAREIVSYDKYCPRAHLLLGKSLYRLNSFKEAYIEFFISLTISIQDRRLISSLSEIESFDFFFKDLLSKKQKSLSNISSFFNPDSLNEDSTISYGPWTQWNSIKFNRDPFFQTQTTQRAMPVRFRKEIYYALSSMDQNAKELNLLINYESFFNSLPKDVSEFLSKTDCDNMTLSLQARLLASLGFYHEALEKVVNAYDAFLENSSVENSYYLSTQFFIEQITFPDQIVNIYEKYNNVFEKIPVVEKTLRIRITMQMSLCVIGGQNQKINCVERHHAELMKLLVDLQSSESFSEFEKNLISSRVYRASSYLPFLKNDPDWLRDEIGKCQSFAYSLKPTEFFEELLMKENLFPLFESSGRSYAFLGDSEASLKYMLKIIEEVDHFDVKALLQVAECYEKSGKADESLHYYKMAASLGFPLGKISYYKLGRILEKNNCDVEALFAYLQSLYCWRYGISALRRINVIAKKLELQVIQELSDSAINELENDFL